MQCECDRRETAGGHLFANAVWQSTSTEQRMQIHLFSLLVGQVAGCTKNMYEAGTGLRVESGCDYSTD